MTQSIEILNNTPTQPEIIKLTDSELQNAVNQLHDYLTPKLEKRDEKPYLIGELSLASIQNATDAILNNKKFGYETIADMSDRFAKQFNQDSKLPVENRKYGAEHLAVTQAMKNAAGLKALESIKIPLKITFLIPVYAERPRVLPYDPETNPHGQNSAEQKLRQISRMQAVNPLIQYEVIYLDDGDKVGSQEVIEPRLESFENIETKYIKLQDLLNIPEYRDALGGISSPDESQKGGAVKAGILMSKGSDLVIVTDADSEMHCEQLGRGIRKMVDNPDLDAASNSRRHESSSQIKTLEGNRRGLLFIALRRGLTDSSINDSQQTLTLRANTAAEIVSQNMNDKYSNTAGYPGVLLAHIERQNGQDSVVELPAQFNADGSASNFNSGTYVKILKDIYYSLKDNLGDSPAVKLAAKIILWIEQNPNQFTEKVKAMGNADFDTSNLSILNREPYTDKPSLRELMQIERYLVDNQSQSI